MSPGVAPASDNGAPGSLIVHASCVALDGAGVLILGASGAGKSGLALILMAYGAALVADDRTCLQAGNAGLIASCPAPIRGRIEARGVGILTAQPVARARVALAVDLDRAETARLPEPHEITLAGITVPLFHRVDSAAFPAAILQYLRTVAPAAGAP